MSKELIEDLRAVSETGCAPDLPFRAADLIEQLQEQLAASQAREAKLREALEKSRDVFDSYVQLHLDKTPPDSEKAARNAFHRGVCIKALLMRSEDAALHEMIQKAGEVMRERCFAIGHSDSIDESIRALPVVTLDDLKGSA